MRPSRSPETIHERLSSFIEAMREKAREQGMAQRDVDDIAYAVIALCGRDRDGQDRADCAAIG